MASSSFFAAPALPMLPFDTFPLRVLNDTATISSDVKDEKKVEPKKTGSMSSEKNKILALIQQCHTQLEEDKHANRIDVFDNAVTQLIDIVISPLAKKFHHEYQAHYTVISRDDPNKKHLGWNDIYFLALLTRSYFQTLYDVYYEQYQFLQPDADYTKKIMQNKMERNEVIEILLEEIKIPMLSIKIIQGTAKIHLRSDDHSRKLCCIELIEMIKENCNLMAAGEDMVISCGAVLEHQLYLVLKKEKNPLTNAFEIMVFVHNSGFGSNRRYESNHSSRPGSTHHFIVETKHKKKYVRPLALSSIPLDNLKCLEAYLATVLPLYDQPDSVALAAVYDYKQILPPSKIRLITPIIPQQKVGNCVTYGYHGAQLYRNMSHLEAINWIRSVELLEIAQSIPLRKMQPLEIDKISQRINNDSAKIIFHMLKSQLSNNHYFDYSLINILPSLLMDTLTFPSQNIVYVENLKEYLTKLKKSHSLNLNGFIFSDSQAQLLPQILEHLPNIKHLNLSCENFSPKNQENIFNFAKENKINLAICSPSTKRSETPTCQRSFKLGIFDVSTPRDKRRKINHVREESKSSNLPLRVHLT